MVAGDEDPAVLLGQAGKGRVWATVLGDAVASLGVSWPWETVGAPAVEGVVVETCEDG